MIVLENNRKPIEVEVTDEGCELLINRSTCSFGQVQLTVGGRRCTAHRLAYEQAYGEIPEGFVVRHKCDNPNCINPKHLELGTHEDNVNDRVERGRSAKGVNNGRAKLTEDDVIFVRSDKIHNNAQLSRMFNVDRKVIRNIKSYKTWKHVE